jgi:hypothetical protein
MYWASRLEAKDLEEVLRREIVLGRYPMRDVIPYIIALFFWDRRQEILGADGQKMKSKVARKLARRLLAVQDRNVFLRRARQPASRFVLQSERYDLDSILDDMEKSTEIFQAIVSQEVDGRCPSVLRQVALQLDISLHAPEHSTSAPK